MPRNPHAARRCAALLAGISILAIASPAIAQDAAATETTGNDIIVTATKRNETIQDVPFSINAQTAADIEKSGSNSLEDVARLVAVTTMSLPVVSAASASWAIAGEAIARIEIPVSRAAQRRAVVRLRGMNSSL